MYRAGLSPSDARGTAQRGGGLENAAEKRAPHPLPTIFNYLELCNLSHSGTYFVN